MIEACRMFWLEKCYIIKMSKLFHVDVCLHYSDCAEKEPGPEAKDDELARRLWDESARLVGLTTVQ